MTFQALNLKVMGSIEVRTKKNAKSNYPSRWGMRRRASRPASLHSENIFIVKTCKITTSLKEVSDEKFLGCYGAKNDYSNLQIYK